MNTLTFRALDALPPRLAALCRQHNRDEMDELVQNVALALLLASGGDSLEEIFRRARATTRRFTQDVAHYARSLDVAPADDMAADDGAATALRRGDYVREVARARRVTLRRARQIVSEQARRAQVCGDLFAADGSGVAA